MTLVAAAQQIGLFTSATLESSQDSAKLAAGCCYLQTVQALA